MAKIRIEIDYDWDSWPPEKGADIELQMEDILTSILVQNDVVVGGITVRHLGR